MATYKLIQDVEADDKLIGPLSFRQFVYAVVTAGMLYISYLLYTHHAELLDIITLPIALFAGFLAFPFGKDQPTEIWALARIRFIVKPRRRIWTQTGVKQLVTINVPKKVEIQRTDGLSQTEVKSRLQALANTIDSRGWATKNVNSIYQSPITTNIDTDRLISTQTLAQNVPDEIADSEDPYDEDNSPVAQQVDQLLSANNSKHRQELLDHLNQVRTSIHNPSPTSPPSVQGTQVKQVTTLPDDNVIEDQLKKAYVSSHSSLSNMHAIRSQITQPVVPKEPPATDKPTNTTNANPVIMNLSQRNDLNVNVISNEANRSLPKASDSDEVLITLH
ncbi:MAG: PrgI family protein [Candidatus Saccharimonadales bacterium]